MKIKIETQASSMEVTVPVGARLLDYLQEADVPINAACGGNGTCHKCRVKVTQGFSAPSAADRRAFREDELAAGWRLSCQSRPKLGLSVEVPAIESFKARPRVVVREEAMARAQSALSKGEDDFAFVCDLGSTGVVIALARLSTREVLIESHLLNRQVRYGADVMTRLASAQKLGVEPLHKAITETLEHCLRSAIAEVEKRGFSTALPTIAKREIVFAGNSAMTTFAHRWAIDTLAVAPFQPHRKDMEVGVLQVGSGDAKTAFWLRSLPLLAGFVGGDTVAGILAVEKKWNPPEAPWMLVDIGTNTEIVLSVPGEAIWFSSAPAGPAFEGGNIAQGMRAEPGAISKARWIADENDPKPEAGKWQIETIGGDVPKGICGSGLIDLLDQAVQGALIHADGYLPGGRLEITPSVSLLADDIREFQLAKSATRSAIDLLIDRAGARPEKIYLAGTFAANLDLQSVHGVGLLPPGIAVETIGNGSLDGAIEFAAMGAEEREAWLETLRFLERPIELALQDDFQDRFVKNLGFPSAAG